MKEGVGANCNVMINGELSKGVLYWTLGSYYKL